MQSDLQVPADLMDGFRPPASMTPEELGDVLARLVWESVTDFLDQDDEPGISLQELGIHTDDGLPPGHVVEEALIFVLWAHTRGAQLAFMGRAPDERIRQGLDALHSAVFEDMVKNGTPESQLPLFEARVGSRYAEYHHASAESDEKLGQVASRRLVGVVRDTIADALRERAIAVANPLRDFLEDVELIEA